jgi:hypothetical protein
VSPTPGVIAELAEHFAFMPEGEPKLVGYYDRKGKLRRIVASYPGGWRGQINIDAAGYVTSQTFSIKLIAKREGTDA